MTARIKLRKTNPVSIKEDVPSVLDMGTYTSEPSQNMEGKLRNRFIEEMGTRNSIIDIYDYWLSNRIGPQLESRKITVGDGVIKLTNVRVDYDPEIINGESYLTNPRYCRNNSTTYKICIKGDVTYTPNSVVVSVKEMTRKEGKVPQIKIKENVILGSIPLMVKSNKCVTSGMTKGQALNIGECTNDPGCYFIIKGGERSIITQEGLRTGMFMIWHNDETGKIEARITCVVDHGTTIVTMVPGSKWDTLKVGTYLTGKDRHIPLYVAFGFLGYNEDNATNLIIHFIPKEYSFAALMYLQSCIIKGRSIGNNIVGYMMAKMAKQKTTLRNISKNANEVIEMMRNDLFPHVKSLHGKARSLAYMAAQIIMILMGKREIDNRDSWAIKKVSVAGKMMEIKLNAIWTDIIKSCQAKAESNSDGFSVFNSVISSNTIATDFIKAFITSWTTKAGQKSEVVTDTVKRDTPLAMNSLITRLTAPSSRKGKKSSLREVSGSQTGICCPSETPDGEGCGLVKNFAMTCNISLDRDANDFYKAMKGETKDFENKLPEFYTKPTKLDWSEYVYLLDAEDPEFRDMPDITDYVEMEFETEQFKDETDEDYQTRIYLIKEEKILEKFPYPIFINGVPAGWCKGKEVEAFLRRYRLFGLVSHDSCIYFNENRACLEIDTSGGRCIRPLLVVYQDKLVIDELKAWENPLPELLSNGCIDMVDSREQEKIMLAQYTDEVRNYSKTIRELKEKIAFRKLEISDLKVEEDPILINLESLLEEKQNYPYTHSEIHPIVIYGNLAGMIPEANKTQAPRIQYQAGMGKQSLNQYNTLHHDRFDTAFKVMKSPTMPLFQSEICQPNGLDEMPSGDTIITAYYAHPDNPEDGIVALDDVIKTKFKVDKYTTHKILIRRVHNDSNEINSRPPSNMLRPEDNRFHAIKEDGFPTIGAFLKYKDAIFGRLKKTKISGNEQKTENISLYVGIGEEGYVDRIFVGKHPEGIVVKIKMRQTRDQLVGDKGATRYSQKGTFSKFLTREYLPRVACGPNKGLVPDLVRNPHAVPSRMPMGEMNEMLVSKAALYTGERVDATTFNKLNKEHYMDILQKQWDEHVKLHPEDAGKNDLFKYGYEQMEVPILAVPPGGMKHDGPKHMVPTGRYRLCRRLVYLAPCYFQILRHQILDKKQVRSQGTISATTHQPIGGRAKQGGQKFGEMERDALISYGATSTIFDRLMYASDAFEVVVCANCGNFPIANLRAGRIKCGLCKDKVIPGRITIPFVLVYLIRLLNLSMISVVPTLEKASNYGTGKGILEDRFVV